MFQAGLLFIIRSFYSVNTANAISSSIGTTAHCGLWPVEHCPFHFFFLSATKSLHLLTPSTWRSLCTSSLHLFLGLLLLLVPSYSWAKIFLVILSSSILSRWPNQLILCPFIHFSVFSPLLISSSSRFVRLFPAIGICHAFMLIGCWQDRDGIVHPVGYYCTDRREYKGQEAALYSGKNCNNILLSNRIIRLKLIHNYLKKYLRYNRCEVAILMR